MKYLFAVLLLFTLTASEPAHPAAIFVSLNPQAVREICQRGKQLGARPDVFAKIGDSITDERWYMYDLTEANRTDLGTNQYLAATAAYYRTAYARTGTSFDNDSVAAIPGGNAATLLDPLAARGYDFCEGRTPLECEYLTIRPSVALIMIGTNNPLPDLTFEYDLGSIVRQTLDRGIVPVLYTIPFHAYKDVIPFNDRIRVVATAFRVPLVDYYAATQNLPNYGIRADGVHPSYPPSGNGGDMSNAGLLYGYPVRNLLSLEVLYQVRQFCN